MTTFASKTSDAGRYLACRPTYDGKVYQTIINYHASIGRFERALDLGCGPGFVAVNLANTFQHVVGLDPSSNMVRAAIQPDTSISRIDYRVGKAEDLIGAGIGQGEDGVDLVVAGQAAHWFDCPAVWKQLTQVVRPGGTVAFIGYAEMIFPHHSHLNDLISHHSHSSVALGPYWQPGRKIVEGLLDEIPFPVNPTPPDTVTLAGSTFATERMDEPRLESDEDFSTWDPSTAIRLKKIDGTAWLMTKTFTLSTLAGYLRSWSALHAYHEAHPDDASRQGKGPAEGDIVDRLLGRIRDGMKEMDGSSQDGGREFQVGWPLVVMMIKKRP